MASVGSSITEARAAEDCEIGDAFADLDAFDAGDGLEVAGENALGFVALESAKCRAW